MGTNEEAYRINNGGNVDMKKFAVKKGSYHMWAKSRIIRVFDTYEEADRYIKDHIKNNEHWYIDIVKEVKK